LRPTRLDELARELAPRDDWRSAVDALRLPDDQARALRVSILRLRTYHVIELYAQRNARRPR
jgi:hypothetical protein